MQLPTTKTIIGGMKFEIEQLNVEKGRELLDLVKHLLPNYAEPDEEDAGISVWGMAYLAGAVDKERADKVIEILARSTTVTLEDNRVLNLGDQRDGERHRETVFSGRLELIEEWIDAALVHNYGGMLGKMKAVVERAKSKAAALKAKRKQ